MENLTLAPEAQVRSDIIPQCFEAEHSTKTSTLQGKIYTITNCEQKLLSLFSSLVFLAILCFGGAPITCSTHESLSKSESGENLGCFMLISKQKNQNKTDASVDKRPVQGEKCAIIVISPRVSACK